jgi:hypothetical protein
MQHSNGLWHALPLKRYVFINLLFLAFSSFSNLAIAQGSSEYPNKPIKLIIPFPEGGSSDGIGGGTCTDCLQLRFHR